MKWTYRALLALMIAIPMLFAGDSAHAQDATPTPIVLEVPMRPVDGGISASCTATNVAINVELVQNIFSGITESDTWHVLDMSTDCSTISLMGTCGTTTYAIYGQIEGSFSTEARADFTFTCWPWRQDVVPQFAKHEINMMCGSDATFKVQVVATEHAMPVLGIGSNFQGKLDCPGEEPTSEDF